MSKLEVLISNCFFYFKFRCYEEVLKFSLPSILLAAKNGYLTKCHLIKHNLTPNVTMTKRHLVQHPLAKHYLTKHHQSQNVTSAIKCN